MLSDAKARKAQPAGRDYKLADEKGLFLLVRANGSKLWRMKYRFAAKEKLLSFGPYPEVSIAEARDRRDAARRLLRDGVDPALEKKRQAVMTRTAAAHTLESVAREWHDLQRGRWTPVHADDVLRSLERDVFPTLGTIPIAHIEPPDVLDLLRRIERRGAIETAKRLRQRMSAVFVYAISKRLAREDPAAIVTAALAPTPKKRKQPAVLSVDELRDLLRKTEASGAYPVTLLASRLLALTAVRPGVVRGARWEEFVNLNRESDLGSIKGSRNLDRFSEPLLAAAPYWHIPAARMKLALDRKDEEAFDHVVPLAPQAVDVLRAVHRITGRGELVFPSQRHAHEPLSMNAIGYLYNRAGWHRRHVPHGWRAAFSTIMNERAKQAGNHGDREVIDLMLAHAPANRVEGAYNRAQFMPRRREIAEEWAALLLDGMPEAEALLTRARRSSG